MSGKDKVIIFDTTMRDGEQSPGASMSLEEKIQISKIFDEMGIDIIEAGFPIASPGDFEAVTAISKILKNSIPCGLSMQEILLMMLSGHVKMEQEQIWIICVKQLKQQLTVVQKQ